MLRKTKILEELIRQCNTFSYNDIESGKEGVTAKDLSDLLQMDRTNVSKELNALHQDGQVIKINGRPVYYFAKTSLEAILKQQVSSNTVSSLQEFLKSENEKIDNFHFVIGNDGSLKEIIKKAKAAMIYPPFGIHTLIVGPTGVGKTMFAEIMYSFGKEYGILKDDSKFVVFNCAEYAENPQLLLGQLFGYEKGAYTGAEKTTEGLVAKANGGVLFLDEIHRLPPEGQEMLFMLLDRGEYRRLGSDENERAEVLIIAATTENLESSLLQTFLRRIPMTITMPSLEERSLKERFDLIEKFFRQEFYQMQVPIHIHKKVMKALLSYKCNGNIGQLRADIRLLCANGFLEYRTHDLNHIRIRTSILQDHIYHGLLLSQNREVDDFLYGHKVEEYVYDQFTRMEEWGVDGSNIYQIINEKYEEYQSRGYNNKETSEFIKQYMEEYMKSLYNQLENKQEGEEERLFKIIPVHIYHTVEVALQIAEQRLNTQLSKKVRIAIALHISAYLENKQKDYELAPNVYEVVKEHPNEYIVAKEIKKFLEKELEISLKEQELIFLTMFLCIEKEGEQENSSIALLALAHGNGVARNMVDVANTLLQTQHGHALDMSLNQDVDEFLQIVKDKVVEIDEGKGVLLLVDMGSFLSFGDIISQKTGISIKTIDMISTPFVLEALRKTMLSEYTLENLYKELRSYTPYLGKLYSKEIKDKRMQQFAIITTCLTGEGAAIKLADMLRSAISQIEDYNIEMISCNGETFKDKEIADKKILAVVGAINLSLPDVVYISSDKVILEDGIQQLQKIISIALGSDTEEISPNFLMNTFLKEMLVFLDPIKANDCIRKAFNIINKICKVEDYNRILIGYMMHAGCMIERCIRKEEMDYIGYEKKIKENENLYYVIRTGLKVIEDEFQIRISDAETVYIMDIFNSD